MMMGYGYGSGPFHWLWFIVVVAVVLYPTGRILNRMGFFAVVVGAGLCADPESGRLVDPRVHRLAGEAG